MTKKRTDDFSDESLFNLLSFKISEENMSEGLGALFNRRYFQDFLRAHNMNSSYQTLQNTLYSASQYFTKKIEVYSHAV